MSFVTSAFMSLMSLITLKVISNPTNILTDIAYIFGAPFGIVTSLHFHPIFKEKLPHLFEKRAKKDACKDG
jgi:hypothetical protein